MALLQTLLSASPLTTTGSTTTGFSVVGPTVTVQVTVASVTGTTPSATFSLLWSVDGVTYSAVAADTFTALTGNGNVIQAFTAKGQFFKLAWTITGTTPSFTTTALAYN